MVHFTRLKDIPTAITATAAVLRFEAVNVRRIKRVILRHNNLEMRWGVTEFLIKSNKYSGGLIWYTE